MTTLHIINKSPEHPNPAQQCTRFYSSQDSILLIEDAVYYTLNTAYQAFINNPALKINNIKPTIYALKEDAEARGIATLTHKDIQFVNYNGFVELTATHDKSTSWY